MKILYGARMCRYDLLRAVAYLATCVTRWTRQCDEDLFQLICYINTTAHYKQLNWVGDEAKEMHLKVFGDADFAGCARTQRSTSGVCTMMCGPSTRYMLSALSKRQTAVSHSTPEAEIIAAALALRTEALPQMTILLDWLDPLM